MIIVIVHRTSMVIITRCFLVVTGQKQSFTKYIYLTVNIIIIVNCIILIVHTIIQ